jgi:hypothetical protein
MARMNGDVLERFISETVETFKFLEVEYGYRMVSKEIENKNYFPDAEAVVRYADSRIGIEVFWYFASSIIGVAFIKLQNGRFPDGKSKDALVINLHALAGYLSQGKDKMFLLKDPSSTTFAKIKKREKIINENMKGVLENLAEGVRKYALDIISGDTSLFRKVKQYQMEIISKLYS